MHLQREPLNLSITVACEPQGKQQEITLSDLQHVAEKEQQAWYAAKDSRQVCSQHAPLLQLAECMANLHIYKHNFDRLTRTYTSYIQCNASASLPALQVRLDTRVQPSPLCNLTTMNHTCKLALFDQAKQS